MTPIKTLSCVACLLLISACAPAGYYDSNGDYRSYGKSDSYNHNTPMAATPPDPNHYGDAHQYYAPPASTTTIIYERPGFYDVNGYYIDEEGGPRVPDSFLPPQGMCRVYFKDRPISEQPAVEDCEGLKTHVPGGGYVIYGG